MHANLSSDLQSNLTPTLVMQPSCRSQRGSTLDSTRLLLGMTTHEESDEKFESLNAVDHPGKTTTCAETQSSAGNIDASSGGDVSEGNSFKASNSPVADKDDDKMEVYSPDQSSPPHRSEPRHDRELSENSASQEAQQTGKRSGFDGSSRDKDGTKHRKRDSADGGPSFTSKTAERRHQRLVPEMAKTRTSFIAGRSKALGGDIEAQRGRRMFQGLLGTLQKFQVDEEQKHKVVEEKQAVIRKKLEATIDEERSEAMKERRHVGDERRKKATMMRLLQAKADAIKQYEKVVAHYEQYADYIRSDTNPPVYYKPKNLNGALKISYTKTRAEHNQFIKVQRNLLTAQLEQIDARIAAVNSNNELEQPMQPGTTIVRVIKNEDDTDEEREPRPGAAGISSASLANRLEMSRNPLAKNNVKNGVDDFRATGMHVDARGRKLRVALNEANSPAAALASTVCVASKTPSTDQRGAEAQSSPDPTDNHSPRSLRDKVNLSITVNNDNRREQPEMKRRRISSGSSGEGANRFNRRRRLSTPASIEVKRKKMPINSTPPRNRPMRMRTRGPSSSSRSRSRNIERRRPLFPVKPAVNIRQKGQSAGGPKPPLSRRNLSRLPSGTPSLRRRPGMPMNRETRKRSSSPRMPENVTRARNVPQRAVDRRRSRSVSSRSPSPVPVKTSPAKRSAPLNALVASPQKLAPKTLQQRRRSSGRSSSSGPSERGRRPLEKPAGPLPRPAASAVNVRGRRRSSSSRSASPPPSSRDSSRPSVGPAAIKKRPASPVARRAPLPPPQRRRLLSRSSHSSSSQSRSLSRTPLAPKRAAAAAAAAADGGRRSPNTNKADRPAAPAAQRKPASPPPPPVAPAQRQRQQQARRRSRSFTSGSRSSRSRGSSSGSGGSSKRRGSGTLLNRNNNRGGAANLKRAQPPVRRERRRSSATSSSSSASRGSPRRRPPPPERGRR